ncbi:hypothetical protein J6590_043941 [Homalodisca vitripennis]|nr:hypothetical protein J6590_043941 [Homalodisca vitripennis]
MIFQNDGASCDYALPGRRYSNDRFSGMWILVALVERYEFSRRDLWSEADYRVFWNVPTFQCHKYGLNFSSVSEHWGLTQNYQDAFRGDTISILYDPGLFPALLPTTAGAAPSIRNGGVPQAGNISLHLDRFQEDILKLMPASNFKGIGIIDFEHWRPIWRQNWMSLSIYKNYSRYLERRRHPRWPKQDIEKEAAERFESAAKVWMLETLRLAKTLRPKALWGYYGFPFCFNNKPVGRSMPCSPEVIPENNRMKWLFSESSALFPSVYLRSQDMSERANEQYITSRVDESIRMSRLSPKRNPTYVYMWSKYQDVNRFLSKTDLYNSLAVPRRRGAEGVVVWGATKDVNSKEKCLAMLDYLDNYLGPTALEVIQEQPKPQQTNFLSVFGK